MWDIIVSEQKWSSEFDINLIESFNESLEVNSSKTSLGTELEAVIDQPKVQRWFNWQMPLNFTRRTRENLFGFKY
jgi:hypothetical protein